LFLAEGARLAVEAADLGVWPEILVFSPAALQRGQVRALIEQAEARRVRTIETSESVLAQISKRDNPQTVIGAYKQRLAPLEEIGGDTIVALEGVRDPGNLGTIVRTADSTGADGVVLIGESCDPFSIEAVRASMGSLFAVKLARATFDELLAFKQARGAAMMGLSLKGAALDADRPAPARAIVLLGNEQSGLPPDMEAACDMLIKLPMRGRADSLNLAIATGVMLYDLWRRRGYDGARA
jgi:TrmH family RNA methyltransferase